MINNIKKENCCGCSACMNVCPVDAIKMIVDENGFKYPIVDDSKCIHCQKCLKTCPIINKKNNNYIGNSYACYNKNINERLKSSSGGIFILIAKFIINNKGILYGASFDDNYNVVHTRIKSMKDINKLMGSKYVQSDIGYTYKKVKDDLIDGKIVLFTGTPCQIEGLKHFLNKEYENLISQDIICHGVPSPKVWEKYLEYRKKIDNKNINNIEFRNKDDGWTNFNIKFDYDNDNYKSIFSNDIYMKYFLSNLSLREACYNCKFKDMYKNSDISLADFWGIEYINKDFFDDNGVSLVIINSKKGEALFNNIKGQIEYIDVDIKEAIKYNSAITKSVEYNKNRTKFFKFLNKKDFNSMEKLSHKKNSFIKRIFRKIKKILRGKNVEK